MNQVGTRRNSVALLFALCFGAGCEVPIEDQISLYDQGDTLHGGPEAYQEAQGVLNAIELREVRYESIDLEALRMETHPFYGGNSSNSHGHRRFDETRRCTAAPDRPHPG